MKYSIKRFTKILITKTKDEEGKWRGATSKNIEDLTDFQLHNLSKFHKDEKQQRRAKEKYKKVGILSTLTGLSVGLAAKNPVIGAGIGATIGAGVGYGYGKFVHNHFMKASKEAEKELNKRYNFKAHIDGKDEKGKFIQPMIGKDKDGKLILGDKIYFK